MGVNAYASVLAEDLKSLTRRWATSQRKLRHHVQEEFAAVAWSNAQTIIDALIDAGLGLPPEIIVVPDRWAARHAGLREGRQKHAPHVSCWWPSLGLWKLGSRPWQRVTIDRDVPDATSEGSLRAILRQRQQTWGDRAIWIEIGLPSPKAVSSRASINMAGLERPAGRRDRRARLVFFDEVDDHPGDRD